MWWNKYVGIPFQDKGRDISGIDCWGLARLVYAEQFNKYLPSFADNYDENDTASIQELIAQYKEGWELTTEPVPGTLILFKVLGTVSHVGIYIGERKFLHAIEGHAVAVESLDSTSWRNRVAGYYNYAESRTSLQLSAAPHPLRTERVRAAIPYGSTLADVYELTTQQFKVSTEIKQTVTMMVNGRVVPAEAWSSTFVKADDVVEYRAVPGKSVLRIVLFIAVAYFAPQLAAMAWEAAAFSAGLGATASMAVYYGAYAGAMLLGGLLVNAIAPIRMPGQPNDPGSAKSQLLVQGSQNSANRYGAIPVVLGKVRMTAPLAANGYVESSDEYSDLNVMLAWGFGPLRVSDLRVGTNSIDQYENGVGKPVEYAHINDTLESDPTYDLETFRRIYANDIQQQFPGIKLVNNTTDGNPWTETTFTQTAISRIGVALHFPQGLRTLVIKGDNAGDIRAKECIVEAQFREVDASGNPVTAWIDSATKAMSTKAFAVPTGELAYPVYDYTSDTFTSNIVNYYRWTRIAITQSGTYVMKTGAYLINPNLEPAANDRTTQAVYLRTGYWSDSRYQTANANNWVRFPQFVNGEIPVLDVLMYGDTVQSTSTSTRLADTTYSGFEVNPVIETTFAQKILLVLSESLEKVYASTYSTKRLTLGPGSISKTGSVAISLGLTNYIKRKDAFTYTVQLAVPYRTTSSYQVRVRRLNSDVTEPDDTYRHMHDVVFQTATAYTNNAATIDPPNCKITKTALRIRATDQLNGQLEGINALVETICLAWNPITSTWQYLLTSNPAALFRYILQHPANAQRIKDSEVNTKINLANLQAWSEYCDTNGFEYNGVVSAQRSVMDVLRDIAAAGRASPAMIDGKWNVIIDKPREYVVQHFTPHNSWGFEGTKVLPKQPDGIKVTFNNEERGFQEEEVIIYNTGKNESNSEIFEQISLPGVTSPKLVQTHTRWHLAQAKLRPEIYSLNTDLEYLICNRGDLVKVQHDVTLWGLSSGRLKTVVSTTELLLDEPVPMQASTNYSVRIRTETGESIVRNVVAVDTDGYYSSITLTSSITAGTVKPLDLFMFGLVNYESNDLIVLSVEPFANGSAKLTLTDYSPEIYSVSYRDSIFVLPEFNSKITAPVTILANSIFQAPEIGEVISDERVLVQVSPGVFSPRIQVSFTNPAGLPPQVTHIEAQAVITGDTAQQWPISNTVTVDKNAILFQEVSELETYTIRIRYVSYDGRTGPWSSTVTHTVIGKTTAPSTVSGITTSILATEGLLHAKWASNPEIDVAYYEIRTIDANWGLSGYYWRGNTSEVTLPLNTAGASVVYYIKAADYSGNYSVISAAITVTVAAPNTVSDIQYKYSTVEAVTSKTNSTVTFTWTAATKPELGLNIKDYLLTFARPGMPIETVSVTGTSYTTRADWIGDALLSIRTVDIGGNLSVVASVFVTKVVPGPVLNAVAEVVDNNVFLRWSLPEVTSLPISHVLIKRGPTWETPDLVIGEKNGTFTSILELSGGSYNYMLAAVDTDSRVSSVVSVPTTVSQPPDFVFNAEYAGNFSGVSTTLVNSSLETNTGYLLMLVDTAETWQAHFSTRTWNSPQDQVTAGYPIYAQPGLAPASYTEVFDYGQVLANSSITVSANGSLLGGTATIVTSIQTSLDNTTWSTAQIGTSAFATNFRYVKLVITASKNNLADVYLLQSVRVRLDSKQRNDGGKGSALASDTLGTIVNFSADKEFIDVDSITVTPGATTPVIGVYDFKDSVLSGTYTLASGTCTINVTAHGLETGQRVRLAFTSGGAISGVYSITKVTANQYTVSMGTIVSSSGNVSTYPQSMRVYLFDNTGTRVSAPFSWALKGY